MALGPKRGPRPVAQDCAACVQAERADLPTKVGADALGPGPGRCGNDMLRALCRKMQRGTRHAANVMPENAARHSATQRDATQCMSRRVASAADLNVACTGVGTLICERDKA